MLSVSVHINASTGKVQRVKSAPMKANPNDKTDTSKQVAGIVKPDVLGIDISLAKVQYKGLGELGQQQRKKHRQRQNDSTRTCL